MALHRRPHGTQLRWVLFCSHQSLLLLLQLCWMPTEGVLGQPWSATGKVAWRRVGGREHVEARAWVWVGVVLGSCFCERHVPCAHD